MKIILSAALAFFLLGCADDATTDTAKKEISKQAHEAADAVTQSTKAVVKKAQEVGSVVAKQVSETTVEVAQSSAKIVEKVAKSTEELAKSIQKKAQEVTAPALDGSKLFTACAGCHGSHGERKAMGKSQIIKGWESAKVSAALHGYKDGTYGGAMKAIMKGQASKLSDDEITAIGDYISKQ